MQSWNGKNVTILGLSKSGAAAARYLQRRGAACFLSETLPATPTNEALRQELAALGVTVEMGGHSQGCFSHADLVIASPGIPPSSAVFSELRHSGKEIISEVELAWRESQNLPWVGITGTNGKTTTTTLLAEILQAAGRRAPACGNIGLPILSVLDAETPPDTIVAELSSFQLELSPTLRAKVAIFLNLTPDHMDWHGSVEAYQRAKLRLFTGAQSPEWVILRAEDPLSATIEANTTARLVWFATEAGPMAHRENAAYVDEAGQLWLRLGHAPPVLLADAHQVKIRGCHNLENILAAASAAFLLDVSPTVIQTACHAFQGVEHRLEVVRTLEGVCFYNDSKATNPEATLSALRAFAGEKVVLIAGGRDKMGPLDAWVAKIQANVAHVVLLGEAQERFADALRQAGFHNLTFAQGLEQAVQQAFSLSQGEAVLFSPACASFDMFKNYEERGRAFKACVQSLQHQPQACS